MRYRGLIEDAPAEAARLANSLIGPLPRGTEVDVRLEGRNLGISIVKLSGYIPPQSTTGECFVFDPTRLKHYEMKPLKI